MTTHHLEIRPIQTVGRKLAGDKAWHTLTRTPIMRSEALALERQIGPHWEARVVAIAAPLGVDFAELERITALKGHVLVRWAPVQINHHPECAAHSRATARAEEKWNTRELVATDLFTGSQWLAQNAILQAARTLDGNKATYPGIEQVFVGAPVVHHGYCPACRGEATGLSVQVKIKNTDGMSTREYLLP